MNKERMKLFIAHKDMILTEAMKQIDQNVGGVLFVVDEDNRLCGAVSDGDIRRWIIKTANLDTAICHFMNTNPKYLKIDKKDTAYAYMKKNKIRYVPLVDDDRCIVDILFTKGEYHTPNRYGELIQDTPVVIMAGGKGTRLYPYTKILPKPLIPIGEIPILERIIDTFCEYGIRMFYLTVNYRKNMIQSYFSDIDKSYEIEYIEEDKPLGTAGSIHLIKQDFGKPIFVTNCDILIREDYSEIYDYHLKSGNAITVVSALKYDEIPYGVIQAGETGEILQIEEKPIHTYFVNTGMYVINPEMIDLIPKATLFHMTDLTNKAMEIGLKVGMFPISEDSFLDMGEFEEMKRMEEKLDL